MRILSRATMLLVLVSGLWLKTNLSQAGALIPDSEAANHVGQEVTIEGLVTKVFKSKNGNTFLDFGGSYPDVTFVVWIPEDAPEAADPGLANLQGKTVKVTGTIQLYRGKPEIKVSTQQQIVVE